MGKNFRKTLIILCSAALILTIAAAYICFIDRGYTEVFFVDVGQGDSCVVRNSKGDTILIDGGDKGSGKYTLIPFLRKYSPGIIDAVFISHLHSDHTSGIYELIDENYPIEKIYISETAPSSEDFIPLKSRADSKNIEIEFLAVHDVIEFDDVTFKVIANGTSENVRSINDGSVIMRMDCGENSFLFTGDITKRTERDFSGNTDLDTDFLKVAHHGSAGSSDIKFIKDVSPLLSIISVGADNDYGHPSKTVINNLSTQGSPVLRTDLNGTVTFVITENNILNIKTTY